MAAPVYSNDLVPVDNAENSGTFSALGGGQSGLNDETDYFIQGTQCVSKNGFTASTRGQVHDDGTSPVGAVGDKLLIWLKQNNRNLMDTIALGGCQVVMGTGTSALDYFYVDGNDAQGSSLAGWKNYMVNLNSTPDGGTGNPGTPTGWDHFGALWKILGSGSLKGAPNAVDCMNLIPAAGYGLRVTDGDLANGYATFDGLAVYDGDSTRTFGILTAVTGGYLFHGGIQLGQSGGNSVDFRDSFVNINVIDDLHAIDGDNLIESVNASNNIIWTNISINQLLETGNVTPNSPYQMDFSTGTWEPTACVFTGAGVITMNSACTALNTQFITCAQVDQGGATITGCTFDQTTDATGALLADDIDQVTSCNFIGDGTTTPGHAVDLGTISASTSVSWDNTLDNGANQSLWTGSAGTTVGVSGDANDAILVNVASGQTLTIATTTNSTIPSVRNTGPGTVIITANTVVVSVTVRDENNALLANAGVYLVKTSDFSTVVLNGVTTGTGIVQDPAYAYTVDEGVTGWVRQVDNIGTDYTQRDINGTIRSGGLQIEVQLEPIE